MSEELFYCSGCGQCCRHIDKAVENFNKLCEMFPELHEEFPYIWSSSGSCEMLDSNNKCKCYNTRPLLCDSGRLLEELQKLVDITKEDFIDMSLESCKYLQGKPIKCSKTVWKVKRVI